MTIDIHSISKIYEERAVVNELSLSVRSGEIVALLGGNGAGKTTLLKMLSGIVAPTMGKIVINGLDFNSGRLQIVRNMGFLTRGMSLYDRFSVYENLEILGRLRDIPRPILKIKIEKMAYELEMESFLFRSYSKLSSGQKQRSLIASTLLHDPEIIILDEVTAELDVISSNYIMELLRRERGRGKTIIFSTHIVSEAEYCGDRLAILDKGSLIAFDSADSLKKEMNALNLTAGFINLVRNYREAA
ncbi:MAG: hypothetical protein A2504_13980 [Bdellovibrionales bacterium RIFOXYD12_FULL_39_22]|nr:MAG: hypothetical protein A2385_00705 [Bdellovibrionales bacterium RIFOXYB1_FULL_39_21]OFZ43804.1 MAG: hypothetical protein A2485_04825 [Bdellovibrionales bacterium RIFOXYC12_FULL_39_17]OFZ48862.1 MAG: hypothetical protein A2404_18020 [Bdellovibrionales bacterium RIFOXYC1_FULL_39_130]OFZ76595.1 MAG: hypothetical protein A2560_06685 [Bdellovibrionales bacterium RIFOXYD1_FULL_39_84]OFZ94829.1 MAG: hypothetical protein A2504_13980 [Bdellovibrionales bacterium RIFOXYD12_FULL_39_22]HLE12255.1 AB